MILKGRGRGEKCMQNFIRQPEGEDNLENLDVSGRIILKWVLTV
jgi:hypothetical protein